MSSSIPSVTSADVERIVRRDFPAERVAEVLALLDEYGTETWHRELDRVRLAVLKLAAGSLERLRRMIELAKCDYRDVLIGAEYPAYTTATPGAREIPPTERKRLREADWKQYQEWLGKR